MKQTGLTARKTPARKPAKRKPGRPTKPKSRGIFVLDWMQAVGRAGLNTSAVAVAFACSMYGDYGSGLNMKVGRERIGQIAGLSPRSVTTQMRVLQEAGLLKWDGVHTVNGRARCYALTIPDERKRIEQLPQAQPEREQVTTPARASNDASAGSPLPPICSIQGTEQRVGLAAPLEAPPQALPLAMQEGIEDPPWPEKESKEPAAPTHSPLDTLTGAWPAMLEKVKKLNKVTWVLLCDSRPTAISEDTITVALGDPGKASNFAKQDHEARLATVLSETLGVPVRVKVAA